MRAGKAIAGGSESVSGDSTRSDAPTPSGKKGLGRRRRGAGRVRKRTKVRTRNWKAGKLISKLLGSCQDAEDGQPGPSHTCGETEDERQSVTIRPPKECYISVDCEMVEITGNRSGLAKCTILDYEGQILFDEYVRPSEQILNYRTRWSGIRSLHMKKAIPHKDAVSRIRAIIDGSIVIGHDLIHDFLAIGIPYPVNRTRDTAIFTPLRQVAGLCTRQRPSLRNLSAALLGRQIQHGPHCSVEDAKAALDIYRKYEQAWENHLLDIRVWLDDQFWPEEICG